MRSILFNCIFFCAIIFPFQHLHATAYVSNGTGNWNTPTIWTPNGTPTNLDNVTISVGNTITVSAAGALCNNLVVTGTLNFSSAQTLAVSGNMTMNPGSVFNGTAATDIVNVAGNLTIAAGGTSTISRGTITVTGTTTVNGTIAFGNATGTKTFNGNVTFNNGSGINFTASETMICSNAVTFNGTVTITGTTAGLMTVGTTATFSAGCSVSIAEMSLTVTGATQIDGTVAYLDNNGTKTFDDITVSATGNWNASAVDEQFVINGNLTVNGTFSASLTTTGLNEYRFNSGTATFAGTVTIPNIYCPGGTILTNNGTITCTDSLYGGGSYVQGVNSNLNWNSSHKIIVTTINATANGNNVDYNFAGLQKVRNTTYYNLFISVSGNKILQGNSIVLNNLSVRNAATLDADAANNRDLQVGGTWNITSTDADPFREEQATVTLNGTATLQVMTSPLAGGETFYDLVINNTSGMTPGITTNKNINVSHTYTHTQGQIDLVGHSLLITGAAAATTDNFSAGSIVSSAGGATIVVTDPSTNKRENFYGTSIGTSAQGITVTVTSADSYFTSTHLYGTANFTKTGNGMDDTQGGNVFYGPVTFTTTAAADRWRMANAQPDTFYNATFNHNGASNFIISRQTLGNAFYGTTTFNSTTAGGMYVSRGNTSSDASSTFFGPVVVNITLSGNMTFSEGAAGINNSTTFNSTITLNSTASSTGDIIIGAGNNDNSTTLNPGAAFVAGTISGQTNLYLRNITQNGATAQVINTSGSTGILYIGGATSAATSYPNIFNGTVTMTADTAGYVCNATFNGNTTFNVANGNGYILSSTTSANFSATVFTIRYQSNTFGGTTSLHQTGTINSTSNGANIYNGATTITNSNTGVLRNASFGTDDFNSDATFVQTGTGILSPVYSNNVTFSGNVSTVGSTSVITFGTTGAFAAIFDGAGTQVVDGPAAFIPIFTHAQTNNTGVVQLNKNISITSVFTMTQGIVNMNGNTLTLGTAVATPGTLNYTAGWLYGGTFTRWMTTPILAVGNSLGLFPMGSDAAQNDYHPFWFAHTVALTTGGTMSVTHNPFLPGSAPSLFTDASWGQNVQAVSLSIWTVSTAGLALNGSNGVIRFGGTGFTPFTLTDLDACLAASAIGTFGAATSSAVPLEVNRTALSTAQLSNAWHIGTINQMISPLPIELLYFNATPNQNVVNLNWSTATETNNDFFTIERSVDGISFDTVGIVDGSGTTTLQHNYSLVDQHPVSGISYYRLKQTDFNGVSTYSNFVAVDFISTNASVSVYPNPGNGVDQNILVSGFVNETLALEIYDATGRKISSQEITTDATGSANVKLSGMVSAAGIYFINVSDGTFHSTQKVVVQ